MKKVKLLVGPFKDCIVDVIEASAASIKVRLPNGLIARYPTIGKLNIKYFEFVD